MQTIQLNSIKSGDEQAFEKLFRTQYPILCGYAGTATGKVGGAQLAGIGNFSREVNAGQSAGIMNIAYERVKEHRSLALSISEKKSGEVKSHF